MGVREKAVRLLGEGRVAPLPQRVESFTVEGEHGTYVTLAGESVALCSCPATGRCSHIEAASAWMRASDMERDLMEAALERRRAERVRETEAIFARLERR